MYTAIVLTPESHNKLLNAFRDIIPNAWTLYCHHMTINMGPAKGLMATQLGVEAQLTAVAVAQNERVMAVKVITNEPSQNKVKHITVAVNTAIGGKPFHSNELVDWKQISPIPLTGIISEVQ